MNLPVLVRHLGRTDYPHTLEAMRAFTLNRCAETPDEIWIVEHDPVFTLGLNADRSHVLDAGNIPVIATDRGGQVTYHGPGQLVIYVLLDLPRHGLGIRELVCALEQAVIRTVAEWSIAARGRRDAPGVYVGDAKLASLGLRIRRRCSYHGLALNVAMDLKPFRRINPCGFEQLAVTQLADLGGPADPDEALQALLPNLLSALGLQTESETRPVSGPVR